MSLIFYITALLLNTCGPQVHIFRLYQNVMCLLKYNIVLTSLLSIQMQFHHCCVFSCPRYTNQCYLYQHKYMATNTSTSLVRPCCTFPHICNCSLPKNFNTTLPN